jgi:hypothetical protein
VRRIPSLKPGDQSKGGAEGLEKGGGTGESLSTVVFSSLPCVFLIPLSYPHFRWRESEEGRPYGASMHASSTPGSQTENLKKPICSFETIIAVTFLCFPLHASEAFFGALVFFSSCSQPRHDRGLAITSCEL